MPFGAQNVISGQDLKRWSLFHLCVVTGWNLDLHLKRQIDMLEEKKSSVERRVKLVKPDSEEFLIHT